MIPSFAISVLMLLMWSRIFAWEVSIASRNSVSEGCVRTGPGGWVCITGAVGMIDVINGAVPVAAGTGFVPGGCTIFCNEVHPVQRVNSPTIINNTAPRGNMLRDLMHKKDVGG